MIDEVRKRIYVDFSTLSRFRDCEEQTRLGSVLGYRPEKKDEKREFGSAVHAGWKWMYDVAGTGGTDQEIIDAAKVAFLRRAGLADGVIPLVYDSGQRRSLERGMMLLEAYRVRWYHERFINFPAPLTEVGFLYYLTTFDGYEVYYVGYIDRIMLRLETKRPVIFEGKTTSEGLKWFKRRVKPNHQITGYFKGAQHILKKIGWDGPEVRDTIWDMMFLSDRAPNMQKAGTSSRNRFWMYGIDIDADFDRTPTSRSEADFTEFLYDAEQQAIDYCKRLTSGTVRWPRSAPRACHTYGECCFIDRCNLNLTADQERAFFNTRFVVDHWAPWKDIVDTFEVIE